MMTTLKRYSLIILSLSIISCAEIEVKSEQPQEEVLIDSSGLFRGYEMGCEPDSLLMKEKWTPTVSNDSTIEFHESIVLIEDTISLDAYLAFDTYGLFEVQVDVFTKNDTATKVIIESWSTKLTSAFGESESVLTTKRWTTFSQSNNTVEITLSQERNKHRQEFISLNYLEPLDDEF